MVYTLRNVGTSSISYQVTNTQAWVALTNASGALAAGATVDVTVELNAAANSLANGTYADTVSFTNTTTHQGDTTRTVTLHVCVPSLVYSWPLDTNPGWTTQGSWAFGHPTGGSGDHGYPDPTNGHTGSSVYGYNLSGGYTNNMSETHLTTTAINCSGLTQVSLRFYRWLGVEQSAYDHAYVRVSNNGTTWTTIWSSPSSTLDDNSWVFQQFDISSIADNQPTVYVRWTMGITDASWTYCGWNIDDVEIWGVSACTGPAITAHPQSQSSCVGQSVTFNVTATGTAPLSYQWRKGGGNIGGATGNSYTINPVNSGDAGNYDCVVTNGCGSLTSNAATLTVDTAPAIIGQPQSAVRTVGESVTFSVAATGTTPLGNQWRKGGGNIGGANGNSYTISPVTTGDAGSYDCVVTNGCGTAPSAAASVTVWQRGDMNCDGSVSFRDINPFVLALSSQASYETAYPDCRFSNADVNGDASVSFRDINPFVALLAGSQ